MKDLRWFVNRLKSMNIAEVSWRLQQKVLQKYERDVIFAVHKPVIEINLRRELETLKADANKLSLNWKNNNFSLFENLDLFGVFSYQDYKKKWNAGFQTNNSWPTDEFSYSIPISQREDIGDIRTNWELNRHYQFIGLAKNYYTTGKEYYITELKGLFYDWNHNNKFLHGVQWISAMEVSIRLISWSYMYAFLGKSSVDNAFLCEIEHGIKVMADHVLKHRAQYSSANNHLIVEMLGVGVAGILFDYGKWINIATKILTKELIRQNYVDGVNKEMSLHYQTFVMEAYGLFWILLEKNGLVIPNLWNKYLENMSKFVADCCGDYGEVIVFGDNDEGKVIDFCGKITDHYRYVLQIMGCILNKRYTDAELIENIYWMVDDAKIEAYKKKELYTSSLVSSYKKGGYTIFRSKDRKVIIGFDHSELGFGSIAAHGHADALSLQVLYEGNPVLIDSGTYNYHVPKITRNGFRKTSAHNTVYIDGIEQAEMLGPFLWGKRFKTNYVQVNIDSNQNVLLKASITYHNIIHSRNIMFDFSRSICIEDEVNTSDCCSQLWHFPAEQNIEVSDSVIGKNILLLTDVKYKEIGFTYADKYNSKQDGVCIVSSFDSGKAKAKLIIKD